MDEAKSSVNFHAYNPDGYNMQFTLREDSEMSDEVLLARLESMLIWTANLGYTPYPPKAASGVPLSTSTPKTTSPTPPTNVPPPPDPWDGDSIPEDPLVPNPMKQGTARPLGPNEFYAVSLTHSFSDGKHKYSITGPNPYHRYGIRIWPEVITEHFDMTEPDFFNEGGVHPLNNQWIAQYVMKTNDKGELKADKVIKLIPV